jgi:hypothetical protein
MSSTETVPTSTLEPAKTPSKGGPTTTANPSGPTTGQIATTGANEAADRQEVESQWLKFWDVYVHIFDIPRSDWQSKLRDVSSPAFANGIVKITDEIEVKHLKNFGDVKHAIYWDLPIGDGDTALIGDCMDQSKFGSYDPKTGDKKTVGLAEMNIRGDYRRDASGVWKLQQVQYLKDEPCG